mgnify:CR=1 FL=1|tara:strand:- start:8670 stop:9137 length:468 start_codon:yes stop_codon:yes gene_type:complete
MPTYNINVNNQNYKVEAEENTPLLWVLRDNLDLVGTKFGCGIGQCGACTIHYNGSAMRSCLLPVSAVGEAKITTIEGLSEDNSHPVQKAWIEMDVPQCGYCQAGQIMTASAFLAENKSPNVDDVRQAMHGNLCRCAAYNRIEKAVCYAAKIELEK